MRDLVEEYLNDLVEIYRSGAREESYYPSLQKFFEQVFAKLGLSNYRVVTAPARTYAGYPDIKVIRVSDSSDIREIIGYAECKNIGEDLNPIEESQQVKKYLRSFENFILTNFTEFRFYRKGERKYTIKLQDHYTLLKGQIKPLSKAISEFEKMLNEFISYKLPFITSTKELAKILAYRAVLIKEKLLNLLSESTNLQKIYKAFRDSFIRNLSEKDFCDTLAQSFVYSMLIAKLYSGTSNFKPEDSLRLIPDNLKLIRDFFILLYTDIRDSDLISMIDDLVEILNKFDVSTLYNRGLSLDDLTTYFYEPFLKEYNPEEREMRGVYFTPSPVVSFIIRSVDELLKKDFELEDGLAHMSNNLRLLDPAAGTLTFILYALDMVLNYVKQKYGEGVLSEWIKKHILKNFYAFELLPAPYVISHLRIGTLLKKYGLEKERFNLYLTNTLELEHSQDQYPLFMGLLRDMAEEVKEADRIKREVPIMVIIGNPPYSGVSANMETEISEKLKVNWDECQSYYEVDGHPLNERKTWLQDDYVKFIRFGQWKINQSGKGILAFITNHAYLDNITFRGMRQSLLKTFDRIYILNLHGNARRVEGDQNVFDIQQGVAIGIFIKDSSKREEHAKVLYASTMTMHILRREDKYKFLETNNIYTIDWKEVDSKSPFYFFLPVSINSGSKNAHYFSLKEIFHVRRTGIVTSRDQLVIGFSEQEVLDKIRKFLDITNYSNEDIRNEFNVRDNYAWELDQERLRISKNLSGESLKDYVEPLLYRPFDKRYIFYHPLLIWRPRREVMEHFLLGKNIGLISVRQVAEREFNHVFVTDTLTESRITLSNRGMGYIFPLYLYHKNDLTGNSIQYNLNEEFLGFVNRQYPNTTPEEIFYYIYAVLYSNVYRQVHRETLRYDFPKIPFFEDESVIKMLAPYGKELIDLHLLRIVPRHISIRFPVNGDNEVKANKVKYKDDRLYINDTQYFEGIPKEVWDYKIGGYQVLKKWLHGRDNRKIDLMEIVKIAYSLQETILIQSEIDEILKEHI